MLDASGMEASADLHDGEYRIEDAHDGVMDVSFWGTEMTRLTTPLNITVFRALNETSSEPTKNAKTGLWFGFPVCGELPISLIRPVNSLRVANC